MPTLYLCLTLAAIDVPPDGSWTLQLFPLTGDAAKALVRVEGVQIFSTYHSMGVREMWGEMLDIDAPPAVALVSPARVKLTGNAPIHFLVLQDEAHVMLVKATPNNQPALLHSGPRLSPLPMLDHSGLVDLHCATGTLGLVGTSVAYVAPGPDYGEGSTNCAIRLLG